MEIRLALFMLRADYEICAYEYTYLFLSLFMNTPFLAQEFSCFSIRYFFFRQMEVHLTSFKNSVFIYVLVVLISEFNRNESCQLQSSTTRSDGERAKEDQC